MFTWAQLHHLMSLSIWPPVELRARFNVAPTQDAPVVRQDDAKVRAGLMMRWGLIPSWAKDPSIGSRMVNARAETAAEKPAFRAALAKRRCLVPVSGIYEWKAGGGKHKQPYWIGRVDREPFALAGLWERWENPEGVIESYTILTTTPNALMATLHDRMPVIVAPGDYRRWLDPAVQDVAAVGDLLKPAPDAGFEAYPVRSRVNSPAVDDAGLIERVEEERPGLF